MAKKRDNGTGCVYKTSRGWAASIQIGTDSNGKAIRKQFSAKTEREVKNKLTEFKKNQGLYTAEQLSKISVNDFSTHWLAYKKTQLKPLSYQRLESTINTHIVPNIGFTQFSSLTTKEIQDLLIDLAKDKSRSTVKKVFDAINAMYSYDQGLPPSQRSAQFNPCENVFVPKCENQKSHQEITDNKIKIFTDDELKNIKQEIYRVDENTGRIIYPYGSLYILILNTGLRVGEALALDKGDVDVESKLLTIYKDAIQIKNENGKGYKVIIQNMPKTLSGNRTLSLNNSAIESIKTLNEIFPNCESLAVNSNNVRVTPQNAEKTLTTILKRAGVESNGRKCHALRHTFATKLFEQGIDVKIVSQILGHSSSSFTRDTYITIIQKVQAKAMNSIPELKLNL